MIAGGLFPGAETRRAILLTLTGDGRSLITEYG